jgi:eukaryotic-like serine/threonine-protein kinase
METPQEPSVGGRREVTAEVGRILDRRWHLKRVLGEGAMGRVFLAQQLSVHRPVAIKVIRPDLVTDSTAISRFLREARILSGLQHPNIVRLIDFGQERATGELYLVMELLAGTSIKDRMEAGEKFTLPEILAIMEQLTLALAESHGRGVIHRDLKPGNLFLDRRDGVGVHVTVFDFGIAKLDEPLMPKLTRTGRINGTPHYIAPEQIRGAATAQTDLYAVGVLLYELLSGSVPHDGDTVMAVLMSHLQREPAKISDVWRVGGPINPAVVDLVGELLERDPRARPKSAVDVYERVRNLRLALALDAAPVTAAGQGTLGDWRNDLSGDHATDPGGVTAPLVSMPDTVSMDAPEAAGAAVAATSTPASGATDEPPSPAPVMGETFDGWQRPPQTSSAWKWAGLGLLGAGLLAVALVVVFGPIGSAGTGDDGSEGVSAPAAPAATAREETGSPPETPEQPVADSAKKAAPAAPAAEPDAGPDEAKLAVEDALEDPPVEVVEPVPTPRAQSKKRTRSATKDKPRRKGGLGDVLKGMRTP